MNLVDLDSPTGDRSGREAVPKASSSRPLRPGEQQLRDMTRHVPAGIFLTDTAGKVVFANEAFTALVGIDPAKGFGAVWRDSLYPEDRDAAAAAWQTAVAAGVGFERELRFRRSDGSKCWVLCNAVPQRRPNGAIDGYMGTVTDITIRRRHEELVAGQNRTLQLLLSGAPLGAVLGELARTVEREHEHEVVAGILLLSVDQRRLLHGAAPSLPASYNAAVDGLEIGTTIGTCAAAAARNDTVITCDIDTDPGWSKLKQLPLPLGLVAAWSMPIRGSKGEVLGTFGTYFRTKREPTEHERATVAMLAQTAAVVIERQRVQDAARESERRYRSLLDSIDDGFCVIEMIFDPEGRPSDYRFVEMNPAFEQHTGLVNAVGRTIREFVPQHEQHWFDVYGQVALTGEPMRTEYEAKGLSRWFSAYAFRDGGSGSRRVAVKFSDVTKPKQASIRAEFLVSLSQRLAHVTEESEITRLTVEALGRHLNVQRCYFAEALERENYVALSHNWCREGVRNLAGRFSLHDFGGMEWWRKYSAGDFSVMDVRTDPLTRDKAASYEALEIRSYAVQPFRQAGEVTAVLAVTDNVPRSWSANDLGLIEDVVSRIWPVVQRARSDRALHERVTLAALRVDVAAALVSDQTVPEVLQQCTEALARHLPGTSACIWAGAESGVGLERKAAAGAHSELRAFPDRITLGDGLIGRIAQGTEPRVISSHDTPASSREPGSVSSGDFAGYPLVESGQSFGVLAIMSDGRFSPAIVDEVATITSGISQWVQRQRALEAIQVQKRLLEALTESVLDGILIVSPEGKMVHHNERFLEIWNFPPEIMEARSDERALAWAAGETADPAGFISRVGAVYQGSAKTVREELAMKDGRVYERFGSPIWNGDARLGWVWTFRDITRRKQVEDALRKSEALYRVMLSRLPVACYTLDAEGRLTFYNQAAEQLWGRAPANGQEHACDSMAMETGEGKALSLEGCAALTALREQRSVRDVEALVVRPDGKKRRVIPHCDPLFDVNGNCTGVINVVVDVTEQRDAERIVRESEAFLFSVVDASADCIKVLDLDGRVEWMSENGQAVMEVCDFSSIRNTSWVEFWKEPDTRQAALNALEAARQGRVGRMRGFCLTCAGNPRWWDVVVSPILGPDRTPIQILSVSRDITSVHEVEKALQDSRAALERHAQTLELKVAERTTKLQDTISELESFSYSISHDLRAPLRAIRSFALILESDCGDRVGDDGKEYIRRIATAAERMDRLIQDVLVYSRLARTEMPTERIELGSFIAGIVESYPQFDAANAKIEIAVPLAAVRANPAALTQCVSNLLDNAIKFVVPGVQPHVRIWTETSPGGPVQLFIQDNAVGISESLIKKIFGTFYQIDPSRGGTGIGLAVVRKAAERMGGSVSVVSEPGKGSTFQLELKPARRT